MTTKQEIEKAIEWFLSNNIQSWETQEGVYININNLDILISDYEVSYRAELYDDFKKSN